MSDIDLAVSHSKRLEALLERNLGATGKGLHEKVSSVSQALPPDLVRRIRLVATVRNKIVHEDDYPSILDRPAFLQASQSAEKELAAMGKNSGGVSGRWVVLGIMTLVAIGMLILWMKFGR